MQDTHFLKSELASPKAVVILTHHKPDADALGSSLALGRLLEKKGHSVNVITPSDYPEFLSWMPGNENVLIYNKVSNEKIFGLILNAEIIFCLDFSSLKRINDMRYKVEESKGKKVLIDHHLDPEDFADYTFWDANASSTAELIFELIVEMGDKDLIDKEIADTLYAGIMTDTGSFKHPNTTAKVHLITAELMALGAEVNKVAKLIYDNNSLDKLKFMGFALTERLKVIDELHVAYIAISASDLKKFNSKTGDTEGLVNFALSLKDIKFAALIIDREVLVKMSFRSVGDFSVNEFARKHFKGGGHKNAAGGRSSLPFGKVVEEFEKAVHEYASELKSEVIKSNA